LTEMLKKVKYFDLARRIVVLENGEEIPFKNVKQLVVIKRVVNPFSEFSTTFIDMFVEVKEMKEEKRLDAKEYWERHSTSNPELWKEHVGKTKPEEWKEQIGNVKSHM